MQLAQATKVQTVALAGEGPLIEMLIRSLVENGLEVRFIQLQKYVTRKGFFFFFVKLIFYIL